MPSPSLKIRVKLSNWLIISIHPKSSNHNQSQSQLYVTQVSLGQKLQVKKLSVHTELSNHRQHSMPPGPWGTNAQYVQKILTIVMFWDEKAIKSALCLTHVLTCLSYLCPAHLIFLRASYLSQKRFLQVKCRWPTSEFWQFHSLLHNCTILKIWYLGRWEGM